jgi:hypothetical protein
MIVYIMNDLTDIRNEFRLGFIDIRTDLTVIRSELCDMRNDLSVVTSNLTNIEDDLKLVNNHLLVMHEILNKNEQIYKEIGSNNYS